MQSLRVNDRSRVGEGVVVGAGDVTLEGEVNRSVTLYAGNTDVSGSIGRELTMAGDHLTVTNTARIGGNLSARVRDVNNVHIASGATITGSREILLRERHNRFTQLEILLLPGCLARGRHAGGMGGACSVSQLRPSQYARGRRRLA